MLRLPNREDLIQVISEIQRLNGVKSIKPKPRLISALQPIHQAPSKEVGIKGQYKVIQDYEATSENVLSLKQNEIVTVISENQGWLYCKHESGKSGYIPAECLVKL